MTVKYKPKQPSNGIGIDMNGIGVVLVLAVVLGFIAIAYRFVDRMDARNIDSVVNAFGTFLVVIGCMVGIGLGVWIGIKATGGIKAARPPRNAPPNMLPRVIDEVGSAESHRLPPPIRTTYSVERSDVNQNADAFF